MPSGFFIVFGWAAVVYKVMKKVGKLTEARMVLPPEPKVYPMVSDRLFEAKVKLKKKLKEDEVPNPRDLASNRPPQASLSTTNSPRRATKASVQVGGPYDAEDNEENNESTTPKPIRKARARAQAGKPLKKGTAKMVASDPGSEMGQRMAAAEKL